MCWYAHAHTQMHSHLAEGNVSTDKNSSVVLFHILLFIYSIPLCVFMVAICVLSLATYVHVLSKHITTLILYACLVNFFFYLAEWCDGVFMYSYG